MFEPGQVSGMRMEKREKTYFYYTYIPQRLLAQIQLCIGLINPHRRIEIAWLLRRNFTSPKTCGTVLRAF